jgi:heat-inducible transcriptional repressor
MLDERKASILRAVVEEYIDTAQPVGSGHVVSSARVSVSAATVRNDMALLEQEGYLHQPHTSAGRVPTEKGYRTFVDELAAPARLDRSSAQQVRAFFDDRHGELEEMLVNTTRLLSNLTQYAAVVVGPQHESVLVRSTQLVDLGNGVALLVTVLSNGSVDKRTVPLPDPVSPDVVDRAGVAIAQRLTGQTLAGLAELPATGDAAVDSVLHAVRHTVRSPAPGDGEQLFVGGAAHMAEAFDAVETVRSVLTILEQQLVVVSLLRDVLDRGLSVAIGTETGVAPLAECSLVVAPYEIDGELAGSIGVLGPTRMNYPQALAAVAVVSRRLGERLTEG